MDPEFTGLEPTLKHNATSLVISEPYSPANKTANSYKDVFSRVEKIVKQEEQIKEFSWTWANKLSGQDINELIQILPDDLTSIRLAGCLSISHSHLTMIVSKFEHLQLLNLHFSPSNSWDLGYRTSIQNSTKNFRESQKWCHLVNKNANQLSQTVLANLPHSLISLSLRNIALGKSPKAMRTLLSACPGLKHLDLGQCLLTDDCFKDIPEGSMDKFANQIISLRLDCNRITRKTLQTVFPRLFSQGKEAKPYSELTLLDIGRTNIEKTLTNLYRLPSLLFLGLSYLQISAEEIFEAIEVAKQSKIEEIVVEYVALPAQAAQALIHMHPCLHSLTLSYIEIPIQVQKQGEMERRQRHKPAPKAQLEVLSDSKVKRINFNYNSYLCGPSCIERLLNKAICVENLAISGTRIKAQDLMKVGKLLPKLKWLQISYLEELDQQTQEQSKNEKNLKGLQILMSLITSLPNIQYIQAYGLLDQKQAIQFFKLSEGIKESIKGTLIVVLDQKGPQIIKK